MGHGREVLEHDSFFCVLACVEMSSLVLCNGYCSLPSVLRYCDSETLRNQFIFPRQSTLPVITTPLEQMMKSIMKVSSN
jgi:hypothetical protein